MKIVIDEEICKKKGLSLPCVLAILLVKTGANVEEIFQNLKESEVIVEENTLMGTQRYITQRWSDLCDDILLTSDDYVPDDARIENLAKSLMEIFPQGKKEGTSVYWKGNLKDNKLRLKKFFKLYGNKYSDEQILNAAKKYIESFNGRYAYMRVLKYFIWKDERKIDSDGNGYVNEVSDLATFIENAGQEQNLKEDWMSTIV